MQGFASPPSWGGQQCAALLRYAARMMGAAKQNILESVSVIEYTAAKADMSRPASGREAWVVVARGEVQCVK